MLRESRCAPREPGAAVPYLARMWTFASMRTALLIGLLAAARGAHASATTIPATGAPDAAAARPAIPTSVIFIHPDGAGLAHWGLGRARWAGPDANLAWDTLPAMALYRPHVRDSLAPASHSGATIHAYGVKVPQDSFGMDGAEIPLSAAGERRSIMRRALREGRAVGIVNSGHLAEPGTAVMLASAPTRKDYEGIVAQLIDGERSGDGATVLRAHVVLGGGESYFLPKGVKGVHGVGVRADGRDLVAEAKAAGYRVVFTREELATVPDGTTHLLGLFAARDTYNEGTEEELAAKGLEPYRADAPTVAEMERAALRVLSKSTAGFFLMLEEEGTDNLANWHHAAGTLEAVRRADEAIAEAERFRAEHPETLVLVAADSCAASPQLVAMPESVGIIVRDKPLPKHLPGDPGPLDGVGGRESIPFVSAPDAQGRTFPFAVSWATYEDGGDPVVVRAAGPGSERVRGNLDNTAIYRILFETLFGETPEVARSRTRD